VTDDLPREYHDRELDEWRDRSDLPFWNRRQQMLADVNAERNAQIAKWGPQHHPDGTSPDAMLLRRTDINLDLRTGKELADIMRARCDLRAKQGEGTWLDILLEETFEALAEVDPAALRKELVQVAAVAGAWIEDIDSRRG
jgi:hypothetical protein